MQEETHPVSCADCWKKELCFKNIEDLRASLLDCWKDQAGQDNTATRAIAAAIEKIKEFHAAPTVEKHTAAMIATKKVTEEL